MFETVVYLACALLSIAAAYMLFRRFWQLRTQLLLLGSLSFLGLALCNIILVFDMVIFPEVDFGGPLLRNCFGALAGCLLLFGLIEELT